MSHTPGLHAWRTGSRLLPSTDCPPLTYYAPGVSPEVPALPKAVYHLPRAFKTHFHFFCWKQKYCLPLEASDGLLGCQGCHMWSCCLGACTCSWLMAGTPLLLVDFGHAHFQLAGKKTPRCTICCSYVNS